MLNADQLCRIDLNLLILFYTVSQEGHVGRAATRMHLTPSAVSHGLKRLRDLFNDPLFLRTPKGVVPTERALVLQPAIQEFVEVALRALGNASPFDPASSKRRFVIGAPDAVLASMAVPMMERLAALAPNVDVGWTHVMPVAPVEGANPWQDALQRLERRELDLAMLPTKDVPARFFAESLYEEDFVLTFRKGHELAGGVSLEAFVEARHLLVSMDGSPKGNIDYELASRGLQRRIAMTVPTFSLAPEVLSQSELIAALPRRFARQQCERFGLINTELPLAGQRYSIQLVATQVALADLGVSWVFKQLQSLLR